MDLYASVKKRGKIFPNKKPLSLEIKRSISLLIFTLLCIIIFVSIVFLLNMNQSSQKGYSLKAQQLIKDELLMENRTLLEKIVEVKSYKFLENNPLIQGMVKPSEPIFMKEKKNL